MSTQLPASKPFRQFCTHQNGWSDHYGALDVAAAYSRLVLPRRYSLNGVWQHGVFGPWQHFHPPVLVYNAPRAAERPVYVARQDEAELLRRHGFAQARAIGMPILYVPAPALERIPGSLLVVPTHSLQGDVHADRTRFVQYSETIKALAHHFQKVTVCIHPNCRRNGLWVKEFSAPGIELVYGAETGDAHALLRMRMLFAQFEFVTTNDWGSHVAYALAFGARVSIAGQPIEGNPVLHARDEMWKNDPAAMARAFSPEIAQSRREYLQRLYVPPHEGVVDVAWGRWFIGAENQLAPEAMAEVLAGMMDPAPLPMVTTDVAADKPAGLGKRVLFVCHEASRTGAPIFLLHFLRWLRRETRTEFEILLGKDGPLEQEFRRLGVVHHREDFTTGVADLARFDLIYANTACNSDLLDAIGASRLPVVTHVHELDSGYEWLGARRMAQVIRQSHHLIACADAVAARLQDVFHIPSSRIGRHYEMIDPEATVAEAVSADVAALRRDYNLPPDAFVLAGCGTVDFRKGPDLFLQVAGLLKRILPPGRPLRCLWIGAVNTPELARLLAADARKLGLEEDFRLIGELPSPHGLLALSNIFCLTSREDPFPLVMLEAAALGKPVVCFAGAGGAGEFCALGGGITVPYLDVGAMAAVCQQWLEQPAVGIEIGQRGLASVREHFHTGAVAPRLWHEINSLPLISQPLVPLTASIAEIYRGWHPNDAPQRTYRQAHLSRAQSRQKARELMQSGRNREAAQLLVKAVNADLALKDGWTICESLCEIGGDLSSIDPKQAGLLFAKAREIAGAGRMNIDHLLPKRTAEVGTAA